MASSISWANAAAGPGPWDPSAAMTPATSGSDRFWDSFHWPSIEVTVSSTPTMASSLPSM